MQCSFNFTTVYRLVPRSSHHPFIDNFIECLNRGKGLELIGEEGRWKKGGGRGAVEGGGVGGWGPSI